MPAKNLSGSVKFWSYSRKSNFEQIHIMLSRYAMIAYNEQVTINYSLLWLSCNHLGPRTVASTNVIQTDGMLVGWLVGWSLMSLFNTNTASAISETNRWHVMEGCCQIAFDPAPYFLGELWDISSCSQAVVRVSLGQR